MKYIINILLIFMSLNIYSQGFVLDTIWLEPDTLIFETFDDSEGNFNVLTNTGNFYFPAGVTNGRYYSGNSSTTYSWSTLIFDVVSIDPNYHSCDIQFDLAGTACYNVQYSYDSTQWVTLMNNGYNVPMQTFLFNLEIPDTLSNFYLRFNDTTLSSCGMIEVDNVSVIGYYYPEPNTGCTFDVNNSGQVDMPDLLEFLMWYSYDVECDN
jgi:hypothetical protein